MISSYFFIELKKHLKTPNAAIILCIIKSHIKSSKI